MNAAIDSSTNPSMNEAIAYAGSAMASSMDGPVNTAMGAFMGLSMDEAITP